MMTAKENFLRTMAGDSPERLVNGWEPFAVITDPFRECLRGSRKRGHETVDLWGTHFFWHEDQPGAAPHITKENKVIKDITQWRRDLVVPDLWNRCADWSAACQAAERAAGEGRLVTAIMTGGIFEQSHFLMGIEDTLCNLLLEPDHMAELLQALLQYKMAYARALVENLRPQVMLSHDDWGEKTRLFMSPDTWRKFFKPLYAELYGYLKDNDVIVMHHADSFCEPIVEDMAEIGINIWQGVLPQNDIPAMQKRLAGRMVLMGGVDTARIDVAGWTEAAVREETRRACREYGPGGYFIPGITYGGTSTIHPEVDVIVCDEISKCAADYVARRT